MPTARSILLCLGCLIFTGAAHTGSADETTPQRKKTAGRRVARETASMAGYLLAPNKKVADQYDGGYSMYVNAWPLLDQYPGRRFQTGLFGTWMFPTQESKPEERFYTDIEGGLGWWRDTRFATETPKFIVGAVALNFTEWANGPGAGKGRDWDNPRGKYGIAQLSQNVLWPPDGLNLRQGTSNQMFGYGYLPLPLTEKKSTTKGKAVTTGEQSWTLFLNTKNFKGPVAFVTPYFWSKPSVEKPQWDGMFLDSRPANPNRHLQMETQHIPAKIRQAENGDHYARVAPVYYPADENGDTIGVHRIMSYRRKAMWDRVEKWFSGGDPADTNVDTKAGFLHRFTGQGSATWRIHESTTPKEERVLVDWTAFATPTLINDDSFGYHWDRDWVQQVAGPTNPSSQLNRLPQYFKQVTKANGRSSWTTVKESEVPAETQLQAADFTPPKRPKAEAYETPTAADSCWKSPGPVAGPFQAFPGDGSVVTYYWYRFADQPALLNADLTDTEREAMQLKAEKLHQHWTKDKEYLPAPRIGELAELAPALIVTPPKGFEVGYVPIATRQAAINK
ncbi:hypothetical protein SAMN06265222_11224 [Neorhodopirellula lusitana]|uniref:Uncharacterized protein n=1 Tax=Neorhodopirellula lusitana TaxID=445327 RepID=A0ABY1QJ03_9BACT|nr:hypothetical protein [Neorhodopirellula lusitana]SMP69384.1 hypothetical protein SAMN06265222_11224 [Neorhodopirellula lusitana]